MRSITVLQVASLCLALTSAGCTGTPDSKPIAPAAMQTTSVAGLARDSSRSDPWIASADSALERYLAHQMYTAPADSLRGFRECNQEGSENSLAYLAAARARVLSRDTAMLGSVEDGSSGRSKQINYKVQLVLAAQLIPYWALQLRPDSVMRNAEPYGAEVGVRVDTVTVDISQDLDSPRKEWVSCGPVHGLNQEVYLDFAKPLMERSAFIKVLRWDPPGGSWAEIRRLADSLARAPH